MDFEIEPVEDTQLNSLLQEIQETITENNNFLLPDDMVSNAIHRACDFFSLPDAPFFEGKTVCILPNDVSTVMDDIFGFSRVQMMEMGINGEDALTLVYTHECAHRILQNNLELSEKEIELACDFFAGVHAGMEGLDTEPLKEALGQTLESDTHPEGKLRADIIAYGEAFVESMNVQHIPITFELCMEEFEDYLRRCPVEETMFWNSSSSLGLTHGENISFGSGWTPEEYEAKANNCYKEAKYYTDKAVRCDNLDDKQHNLNEAKKWQDRGDEYMNKAKYARK